MKKGIFVVANLKSQEYCENLIYSIRKSGCTLPIRLIHFGGEKINSEFVLSEVEFLTVDDFSEEAKSFITNLRSILTGCPMGFLYRFLGWFSDWDEFIYSDNDIVALMNWERLFEYLEDNDLVHADEEYKTLGKFNYLQPKKIEEIFGKNSLSTAITAGHILIKNNQKMIADMNAAVNWFKLNPEIPKKHDQSLLHVASLLGNWKVLNLCKPPYNWLSSWSGDYKNSLDLIQKIQSCTDQKTTSFNTLNNDLSQDDKHFLDSKFIPAISHIHYSGRSSLGTEPIDDLMFSNHDNGKRMMKLFTIHSNSLFFITYFKKQFKRVDGHLKRQFLTTKNNL
jgi:hypothetical protein